MPDVTKPEGLPARVRPSKTQLSSYERALLDVQDLNPKTEKHENVQQDLLPKTFTEKLFEHGIPKLQSSSLLGL